MELSQHFIQALNLKVEPRDFKKFMIPQTQGIFPHDHYLRSKSVKPALCGLALFPELQLRGVLESQESSPGWGPSRRLGWGGVRSHPHPCHRTKEASRSHLAPLSPLSLSYSPRSKRLSAL